jgi:HSP20 family protein
MANSLTRWTQLNELEDLQHSLGSLFSRSRVHWPEGYETGAQWIPLVDISEDAKGYLIKAELPQVKQEDLKITMEDGTMTITGDRKFEENSKKDHRVERAYGRFLYNYLLPADASPAKVTTEFADGVLKVHLAKNVKAKPLQVEAEAAAYHQIPNHQYHSSGWGIDE